MLQELSIKHFALIEDLKIPFEKGITVITGETGSGKSILMDALSILLGERASVEYIRHGEERFIITGMFYVPPTSSVRDILDTNMISMEEDVLVLSRSFNRQGRSHIIANGQTISLKVLRGIGQHLADIHGQYSNQELLDSESHHDMLDSYNTEAKKAWESYQKAYKHYVSLDKEWTSIREAASERLREMDMLQFQIDEILEASPTLGEDIVLEKEIERFENFEKLYGTSRAIYAALYEGRHPVMDALGRIREDITRLAELDETLAPVTELFSSGYFQIEEAAHDVSSYTEDIFYDEEKLAQCRERDTLLYHLKKKYGPTLDDVLDFIKKAQDRYEYLSNITTQGEEMEERVKEAKDMALKACNHLNAIRKKHAPRLTQDIMKVLKHLGMEKAELLFTLEEDVELSLLGMKTIELLFSPNKGEGLRPFHKIASGGELSRLALALSSVLKRNLEGTIVFDEIDVGISGDAALKVAETLANYAKEDQILCITHMPQTVAVADTHYHLTKEEVNGRTITKLSSLTTQEHIQQIAIMISGSEHAKSAAEAAKELIHMLKG